MEIRTGIEERRYSKTWEHSSEKPLLQVTPTNTVRQPHLPEWSRLTESTLWETLRHKTGLWTVEKERTMPGRSWNRLPVGHSMASDGAWETLTSDDNDIQDRQEGWDLPSLSAHTPAAEETWGLYRAGGNLWKNQENSHVWLIQHTLGFNRAS